MNNQVNNVTGVINNSEIASIQEKILTGIVNPIILIASSIAFAWFCYGGLRYIIMKDNPDEREKGKKHLVYGTLALFIMFSIWGILNFLGVITESKVWFITK